MKSKFFLKVNVGIDISKDTFSALIMAKCENETNKVLASKTFGNNSKGFNNFMSWVQSKTEAGSAVTYTMEATGVYYQSLAYFLFENQCAVSVVLANIAKKYLQSLPMKSKTDKQDSKGLAQMGLERKLQQWTPPSPKLLDIKNLLRERNQIVKMRTSCKNQLHAYNSSCKIPNEVILRTENLIANFDNLVQEIEKEVNRLAESVPELWERVQKIITTPGIRVLTALTIVAETDGFALIKNIRQLVSYAGYDIVLHDSGSTIKGKPKISKRGNSNIRAALYCPAMTASQFAKTIGVFYKRIKENKGGKAKVANTAVQRKLLILIYVLWRDNVVYIDDKKVA